MIAEEQTNAASLKEKASNVFTALLSLYPARTILIVKISIAVV